MATTTERYLEYLVHGFHDSLLSLAEFEHLDDENFETVYALGYNYFTYGQYEAARDIFVGLTKWAPDTAHYWRALGAVNQQLKDYRKAIAAYDKAIANDEADVVSYVYRGECQILSKDADAAQKDFEEVLRIGARNPQFEAWVKRARLLLHLHRQT
jgi:type III secretion system low calcium response chaperone LcrH/SycD